MVIWNFPTRVLFGADTVQALGNEAKQLGGTRALVVADPGIVAAGLVEPVGEALRGVGIGYEVFDAISSNPLEAEVLAGAAMYSETKADFVVAVGGGSPLDVAKLIRLAATHPLPLAQYDDAADGYKLVTNPVPPMIAVPTSAGTGSEVGRSGVVTLEATHRKTVIFAPALMPNVAVLDPQMTTTMPATITAATGFDALVHCIEAYCALGDHPMADGIALEGIRLVEGALAKAVQEPENLTARGDMLKAAMMGAVAFQKGLGACHSLAHPLSTQKGMHHGLANALCIPAVLDYNRNAVPGRIAQVARILGVRGDDTETLAFECSGAVRALRSKVGLPDGLEAAGVTEDALPALATEAFEDVCHKLNPRSCSEDDLLALYKSAM